MPTWWHLVDEILDPVVGLASIAMLGYGLWVLLQINQNTRGKDRKP